MGRPEGPQDTVRAFQTASSKGAPHPRCLHHRAGANQSRETKERKKNSQ